MAAQDSSQEPQLGTISADVNCVSCGYNLRGLQGNQACPECGTSIAETLRDDLLPNCNPAWLATLRCGLWLLIIWQAAGLAGRICSFSYYLPGFRNVGYAWMFALQGLVASISEAMLLAAVTGIWLLTAPSPARGPGGLVLRYRWALRAIAVALVAVTWISHARIASEGWWTFLRALQLFLLMAQGVLTLVYLKPLALRVLDVKLARFTEGLIVGTILVMLVYFATTSRLLASYIGPPDATTFSVGLFLDTLLIVAWLLVLHRYRQHLDRSIATSATQWQPRRSGMLAVVTDPSAAPLTATTGTPAPAPGSLPGQSA